MKGRLTNDEFITDADLKSYDRLMYGREVPSEKAKKPKKIVKEPQNGKLYRAHQEEKEKLEPVIYTEETATVAAIAIVSVRLDFDLVSTQSMAERGKRLRGYATFAQLIRLMLGSKFDIDRIYKAIGYENKPSLEVLKLIFDDLENRPFRYDKLQAILKKYQKQWKY
jgi:hypothetical protein